MTTIFENSNAERCLAKVYPNDRWGSFHPHQCTRKVWKDGFCKQHHPESEAKRRVESNRKLEENFQNSYMGQLQRSREENKLLMEENKLLREENEKLKKEMELKK
jgi:hypothetical protein